MTTRTGLKDMNELSRTLFLVIGVVAPIIVAFGGWWLSRIDDRLVHVTDTYATKVELREIKEDIKDLKRHITDEIRSLKK